jgi:hypothetical protein
MLTTRHPLLNKEITAGHIDIANDQTGGEESSHHDVAVFCRAKGKAESELLTGGRLENFQRSELSYYDMVHQALNAVAGDGFAETAKAQPILKVTITQIPGGTGQPKLEGLVRLQRLKGGSDIAARYKIELFATNAEGQLAPFREGQLRDFDTTNNGPFALLQAGMNASVQDGFYRRSRDG